jgi:hypothetical protein
MGNTNFKTILSKNPYELDVITGGTINKLTALTEKNSDFIEAVVKLDSNYKKEAGSYPPDQGFDPETMADDANGLYHGSSSYWFNMMRESHTDEDFKKAVLGAVIAIDASNSTHLSSGQDGRKEMGKRICDSCHFDLDTLKALLNRPFDPKDQSHLINRLNEPILAIKTKKDGSATYRFNISFVSKFCSYASSYFGTQFEYPKYDNVVSDWLGRYALAYLGKRTPEAFFKMPNGNLNKDKKEIESQIYRRYWDFIKEILEKVNIGPKEKPFERFDHIVWYANKG